VDRFIPSRSALDLDVAHYNLSRDCASVEDGRDVSAAATKEIKSPAKEAYKKSLADNFHVAEGTESAKILAFKSKAPAPPSGMENTARGVYTNNSGAGVKSKKTFRAVPSAPERILDAPELIDDYYLNLIDWGSTNQVAVALGCTVYMWDAETGAINQLCQTNPDDAEDYVTSVNWGADGKHIAIGTNSAEVQIWDASQCKKVRTLRGHAARIGATSWNGSQLATGSRDNTVMIHDVRVREHCTSTLQTHTQEVCGLKWSPSGTQLASGGNDNLLHIYDATSIGNQQALHRLDAHQAAVKALAWCPFQSNLLASGGGTADRCIKFWNTNTGAMLNSVDTHSQVCALQWNTHERELLSSHGYSQNQLCLWKYPTMTKMAEMTGHQARVLHMAQSPDGTTVVSAAADETLRFWKCFDSATEKAKKVRDSTDSSVLRRFNFR
jgi:cell division cycle protein 20 (cofactor of APC complex)